MDKKEIPNKLELSDDDYVVFIPEEDYQGFMRSHDKLEQAQQELLKLKNGELQG